MPRSLRKPMIFWMSRTAIGSTPANGSSSRMKRGRVASARAISQRRRSPPESEDRKSTRLNSSHLGISYAVFCLQKKKRHQYYDNLRISSYVLRYEQKTCQDEHQQLIRRVNYDS